MGWTVKLNDDVICASRYGMMMLRHAITEPSAPRWAWLTTTAAGAQGTDSRIYAVGLQEKSAGLMTMPPMTYMGRA